MNDPDRRTRPSASPEPFVLSEIARECLSAAPPLGEGLIARLKRTCSGSEARDRDRYISRKSHAA